uniref:SET domain-containing protein n=1 Tax=Alexandrium monilatum TaxID=311494 RepID=A0A6T0WUU2_9DINO
MAECGPCGAADPAGPPAALQPTEPVAIVLPDCITPGLSKVEVDVKDGERLQLLVPKQARPGDRLVFTPKNSGAWGCSILRPESQSDPGASSAYSGSGAAPARGRRRQLEVRVPEAKQGELEVDVGGETLTLAVPECARPGDRLRLTEDEHGQWHCQLEQSQKGRSTGSRGCRPHVVGDEIFVEVPPDAKPGETRLRLSVGQANEHPLVVMVPENAIPGDELALSRKDGRWNLRIIRETEGSLNCAVSMGPRRNVTLCRVNTDPHEIFQRLATAANAAGAQCSPKLARGATPPLDALGVIVTAPVEEGEELARIPSSLHLSTEGYKERMPELYAAVMQLKRYLGGRAAEAAQAACLARLLQETWARMQEENEDAVEVESKRAGSDLVEPVWDLFARNVLSEDWDSHPYWCSIEEPVAVNELLAPSREQEYLATMAGDVMAMHDRLVAHIDSRILGPNFHVGFFLQARLCILTRVFQMNGDSALVPLNDCFNHSSDPGATWEWDAERNHMVMIAKRGHAPGEQVFISYGRRSNVLLFRTYGFTLPPQVEPNWTFIFQTNDDMPELLRHFPAKLAKTVIHLESGIVQDSLIRALNRCREEGYDPEAFLRKICEHCLQAYDQSESLQPALAALRRARAKDPKSSAWWAELSGDGSEHTLCGEGALAGWEEHALRVKMSEYLCLTAHLEVVDLVSGRLAEEQCLDGAKSARGVLAEGFDILRNGGYFSCNLDCSIPDSMIRGLT